MSRPEFTIVQYNSFGDLVIAVGAVAHLPKADRSRFQFALGEHLLPLYEALGCDIPVRVIRHGEDGTLPAVFAIRSHGIMNGLRSAWGLRQAVARLSLPLAMPAILLRSGPRERFVTPGLNRMPLPPAPNVYLAYRILIERLGLSVHMPPRAEQAATTLRIFPGSRVPAKNLSIALVGALCEQAAAAGIAAEVMVLEGERPDLEASAIGCTIVPRCFDAMIDAVRGGGRIVSADSMPAHIAEYLTRPVFVFSPVENAYFYPLSSFTGGWNARFDEGAKVDGFARFLSAG